MIEPDAATDLRIAKACGIPVFIKSTQHLRQSDRREFVYYHDTEDIFSPTTDLNDAMEAAKKILAGPYRQKFLSVLCSENIRGQRLPMWADPFFVYLVERGPLAICAAIEATAEEKK